MERKNNLNKILISRKISNENLNYNLSDINESAIKIFIYDVSIRKAEEKWII